MANKPPRLAVPREWRAPAAIGTVVMALGITGAIDGFPKTAKQPIPQPHHRVARPKPCSEVKEAEAYGDLCKYAFRFNADHLATVAMDTCVAWKDQANKGIAVTYNPGFDSVTTSKGDRFGFLVFEDKVDTTDFTADDLIMDNGPAIFTDNKDHQTINQIAQDVMVINYRLSNWQARVSDRHISPHPSEDPANHSLYFTDAATGQPVIHTELATGSLSLTSVAPICNELRSSGVGSGLPA